MGIEKRVGGKGGEEGKSQKSIQEEMKKKEAWGSRVLLERSTNSIYFSVSVSKSLLSNLKGEMKWGSEVDLTFTFESWNDRACKRWGTCLGRVSKNNL